MRFMRGQLRSTITNGHRRLLAIHPQQLRQTHRCICNVSKVDLRHRDRVPQSTAWPATCHGIRLRPTNRTLTTNSAAAAEAVEEEASSEEATPEPATAETNDEEVLLLVKNAYAKSKDIRYFSTGFLIDSKQACNDLAAFLHSDDQIAMLESAPTHLDFLKRFAPEIGLRTEVVSRKHLPSKSRDPAPVIVLLKSENFVPPPEEFRRQLETILGDFLFESLTARERKSFMRYLRKAISYRDHKDFFMHSHSLVALVCRDDINQIPTFSILDSLGKPPVGPNVSLPYKLVLSRNGKVVESRTVLSIRVLRWNMEDMLVNWLELHKSGFFPNTSDEDRFDLTAGEWDSQEFLSRACRVLNYGHVTCDQWMAGPSLPGLNDVDIPLHFWKTKIGFSDHTFHCKPVLWTGAAASKKLAVLQACLSMKSHLQAAFEEGSIVLEDYEKFAKYWETGQDPAHRYFEVSQGAISTALVDTRSITGMVGVLKSLRDLDQEQKPSEWLPVDESLYELIPYHKGYRAHETKGALPRPDAMARMRSIKASLPISQGNYKQQIRESIQHNDITIIKATTGSGKTTQVPQFLLDEVVEDGRNIVCTQPRRIAAISVAKRVANERGQAVGDEVGYQVRFKDEAATATFGINYVTAGYLLRLFESDPKWICDRYTHIIFDEVHERDLDTDLLLTGMKNLMLHKPIEGLKIPKLVLMSATLDVDMFVNYFADIKEPPKVASIEIPGKQYPVSTTMLEDFWPQLFTKYPDVMGDSKKVQLMTDYLKDQLPGWKSKADIASSQSQPSRRGDRTPSPVDSAASARGFVPSPQSPPLLNDVPSADPAEDDAEETEARLEAQKEEKYIVPTPLITYLIKDLLKPSDSGDMLVFLPGLSEIETVADDLVGKVPSNCSVSKLHSSFGDSNFDAWEPTSPGSRRIFLSTNIAETSITLPNVTIVIDTGYSKSTEYDQVSQLESFGHRWISKAEVAQRRGRAGRTAEGRYYATYSQKQYDLMKDSQLPEILRSNLTSIVLRTECGKAFRRPPQSELARVGGALALAPSPPRQQDVEAAADQLRRLHAFTADLKLTALGASLSRLPIDPDMGKTVLMALVFRCLGPAILMAATSPDHALMHHPEKVSAVARVRKEIAGKTYDDRLADTSAFIKYALADARQDIEGKSQMEEAFFRVSSFTAITRYSSQLIDSITTIMDIPRKIGRDYNTTPIINSLFTGAMAFPNTSSSSADLVKALNMASAGMRVAKWDGKHWRNEKGLNIMPSPRSVNHDGHKSELRAANKIRREPGDLLSYVTLRKSPDSPAWAHETSVMSPLAAMLFAESLRIIDDDILLINDWMKYKIEPQGELGLSSTDIAKIILEYRKALDRFIAQAFSNVCHAPSRLAAVRNGAVKANSFNTFLRNSTNPVRDLFTDSLVNIFKFERESKAQRKEARRAAAEADAPPDSRLKIFLQQVKDKL